VRAAVEEQAAVRTATDPGDPALGELLAFWDTAPHPDTGGDVNLVFADEHFHETLAAASGSRVLPPMLRNINERLHALRIRDFLDPERVQRTYEQHAAVVRCLLDGDVRLATAILKAHIWESHAFVRQSAARARAERL